MRTTVLTLAICSVLMMLLLKEKYKLFGFLLLGVIVSTYLMFEICQGCIFPGLVCFDKHHFDCSSKHTGMKVEIQVEYNLATFNCPSEKQQQQYSTRQCRYWLQPRARSCSPVQIVQSHALNRLLSLTQSRLMCHQNTVVKELNESTSSIMTQQTRRMSMQSQATLLSRNELLASQVTLSMMEVPNKRLTL